MLVMLNSGVLSPTMPSTVSRGQRAVNGACTTVNNRAFVVTHNNKTGKAVREQTNNVVFLRPKLQAGLLFWKQRKGSLSLLPQRFKHLQPRLVVAMKTYSLTNGECRESLIKPHVGPEALKSPGKLGCSWAAVEELCFLLVFRETNFFEHSEFQRDYKGSTVQQYSTYINAVSKWSNLRMSHKESTL